MYADAPYAWDDSHIRYDMYTHSGSEAELEWRDELVNKAPHGQLLTYNSFFRQLRDEKKVSLLHVTSDLRSIEENGTLYPSGGCLVGSIYCTPLFPTAKGLLLHNLGRYLFFNEAPTARQSRSLDPSEVYPVLIEIEYPAQAYRGLIGLDYLRLGNVHLQIFEALRFLVSPQELLDLEGGVVNSIKNSFDFLSLCSRIENDKYKKITAGEFISLLAKAVPKLPILGYFYFEVLSEYIMLFSQDRLSHTCAEKGELNSWGYKELLFGLNPDLRSNFNLGRFNPEIPQLAETIRDLEARGLISINIPELTAYVMRRLSFLVCARLLGSSWQLNPIRKWDFRELSPQLGPLLGHLVHRALRSLGRYPDFYFYYDQQKALHIWNYWNHVGIMILFNGVIPKGELGPNPANPDLKYRIFEGRIHEENGEQYFVQNRLLNVRIRPRLGDLKFTFMRDGTGSKPEEMACGN
jgi:hypothetical protein